MPEMLSVCRQHQHRGGARFTFTRGGILLARLIQVQSNKGTRANNVKYSDSNLALHRDSTCKRISHACWCCCRPSYVACMRKHIGLCLGICGEASQANLSRSEDTIVLPDAFKCISQRKRSQSPLYTKWTITGSRFLQRQFILYQKWRWLDQGYAQLW